MTAPIPELFDPTIGPAGGWPAHDPQVRAYLQAFAANPSTALIANLRTKVLGCQLGGRVLPVTVNDGEVGDSYVCLPHSAYALYGKEELRLVDVGPWAPALGLVASGAGALMRAVGLNRIVHLDNWMVSTNLHAGWDGAGIGALRALVTERFPGHVLAIRSLSAWADAPLMDALRQDGWLLLPSRQIYVTDDPARDWAKRRDTRNDLRLWDRMTFTVDALTTLAPRDADRIAELYAQLYLERYSRLNPVFTPAFIAATHAGGVITYRGLRDHDGQLVAVVGCLMRADVLTTPIVGYDFSLPQSAGLYRLCTVLLSQEAIAAGVRLNGSAGAATFKRTRGAVPVIEYGAYYTAHLGVPVQMVVRAMERVLTTHLVPMMQERGL